MREKKAGVIDRLIANRLIVGEGRWFREEGVTGRIRQEIKLAAN